MVKATEIDDKGRLNLSRKVALQEMAEKGDPIDEKIDPEAIAAALAAGPPPPREPGSFDRAQAAATAAAVHHGVNSANPAIRVALAGYRGKVGVALARALESEPGIEYVGGVEAGDDLLAFLEQARPRVLVDFTHPSAALNNALAAVAAGASPVVGTTGIPIEGVARLEQACAEADLGGIVAPNFAVGAVLMTHLGEIAAPFFAGAEIIELHHETKADAPSGTALATARRLAARGNFHAPRPQKSTLDGVRGGEEGGVAIHSVRLPGMVADQEIILGLPGQTLTISHRTTSRDAFVPGVVLAIGKVVRDGGFYISLDQILGL